LKEASSKKIPEFSFTTTLIFTQDVIYNGNLFGNYYIIYILTGLMVFIIENPEYWSFYSYSESSMISSAYDEDYNIDITIL
jgi:hypothetical protein